MIHFVDTAPIRKPKRQSSVLADAFALLLGLVAMSVVCYVGDMLLTIFNI